MQLRNIRDYKQYLFGLQSGITGHEVLQTRKALTKYKVFLVTFGAYLRGEELYVIQNRLGLIE